VFEWKHPAASVRIFAFHPILLLFVWVCTANAQQSSPSATTPFFTTTTGNCKISATSNPAGFSLQINLGARRGGEKCSLSKDETVPAFDAMFQALQADGGHPRYGNIMIGRIRHYGWMLSFLSDTARRDANWSAKTGRPRAETTMSYINGVLSSRKILDVFDRASRPNGYLTNSSSCEEILISADGLPTDALCWIDLKRVDRP